VYLYHAGTGVSSQLAKAHTTAIAAEQFEVNSARKPRYLEALSYDVERPRMADDRTRGGVSSAARSYRAAAKTPPSKLDAKEESASRLLLLILLKLILLITMFGPLSPLAYALWLVRATGTPIVEFSFSNFVLGRHLAPGIAVGTVLGLVVIAIAYFHWPAV
jgi:hypothetical protein